MCPCKMIGVTGSDGKTTTTSLINSILQKAGFKTFLGGNIGTPLFTKLPEMKPEDILVLELSSFQLMGMEVSPDIAVITNITSSSPQAIAIVARRQRTSTGDGKRRFNKGRERAKREIFF